MALQTCKEFIANKFDELKQEQEEDALIKTYQTGGFVTGQSDNKGSDYLNSSRKGKTLVFKN